MKLYLFETYDGSMAASVVKGETALHAASALAKLLVETGCLMEDEPILVITSELDVTTDVFGNTLLPGRFRLTHNNGRGWAEHVNN